MKKYTYITTICLLLFNFLFFSTAHGNEKKIFYAGFSFSGNYIDKKSSIKFTNTIIDEKDDNGLDVISSSLIKSIKRVKAKNFNIDFNFADLEKGLEESVVMAVVLDHENYFSEYEPISKTHMNNIQ